MSSFVLALDQGTTSSRALLFDEQLNVVATAQKELQQYYPKEGWVEHDPMEIWAGQYGVLLELLAQEGLSAKDLSAIGITNQRETTIVWEKETGKPVYPAIVWQCRRTASLVDDLLARGLGEHIRTTTGLIPDAYFSGPKLAWILDHVPHARQRAGDGQLLFGTVDTWLLWKLSGGQIHATDHTNASRTMLYDIHRLDWDQTLLDALDIPRAMLPQVKPSASTFGFAMLEGVAVPVGSLVGDQQAALFGQGCRAPGEAKNTYGTGCFLLMHTGNKPVISQNGLITTLAASCGKEVTYALEGSVFVGGAVVQWLRDELGILKSSREVEVLARTVADNGGVYLVPAFTGLGAPHWDMYARGCLVGLTRGSNRAHIARAAEEAIAFQVADLIDAMVADSGLPLSVLRADGGACGDDFLLQCQADFAACLVERPEIRESTALGAALLAGISTGLWREGDFPAQGVAQVFSPRMEADQRKQLRDTWQRAVIHAKGWLR